jgi:hypothetical protein
VKQYHSELRKYIDDADQWLNKTNSSSKKAKYRVTQIFTFFSEICQEKPTSKKKEKDDLMFVFTDPA